MLGRRSEVSSALLQRAGPPESRSEGVWRVRSRSCIEVCRARSGAHPRVCRCHDAHRPREQGRHQLTRAELSVVTSTCRPFEGERAAHQSLLGARAACPAATARPGRCLGRLRRFGGEIMLEKGTAGVRVVGRESPGNAIAARSLGSATETVSCHGHAGAARVRLGTQST